MGVGVAGLDGCGAHRPVEVMGGGGGCFTGHKKPTTLHWGFRGRTTGSEGVPLIYDLLCSLVNKNKTAGVITNSLLTGGIIYVARGGAGPRFPTTPELG